MAAVCAFSPEIRPNLRKLTTAPTFDPWPSRNQLYSSLWVSCDKLRGDKDASQYKDYVLFSVHQVHQRQVREQRQLRPAPVKCGKTK